MGVKKNETEKSITESPLVVFLEDGGKLHEDAFGISERVSRLQAACFGHFARLLGGFSISGSSAKGALERRCNPINGEVVLMFSVSYELTPITRGATERCRALLPSAQQELPPDEIRP